MANIKAAEVAKLRKQTGAGMMDCKKALTEANGDFDAAIEILRKKGQKIASKRADREATEGVVLAATTDDKKNTVMVSLNCETDFVAKNDDFVKNTKEILDIALNNLPETKEDLMKLKLDSGLTIEEQVVNLTGIIGEKIELAFYGKVTGETTGFYVHSDKKVATIVAANLENVEETVLKDVAMQATAMNPVALDQKDVPEEVVAKELEIGKELARNEGKPEKMLEQIAKGRLGKFFKENTLLNQMFVKNNKISVKEYLKSVNSDLTVVDFKRFSLRV